MALGPTVVYEVRTTGHSDNGGGYDPVSGVPGVDRLQQDNPHVTIDGTTITSTVHTSTDQLTLSGYTVAADDVGNILKINGGTATAGRYRITAVDATNNRWTLDRSAGTAGQTATGRMGGALASPLDAPLEAGRDMWIKQGTYLLGSMWNITVGFNVNDPVVVRGYNAARGDDGRPTLKANAAINEIIQVQAQGVVLIQLILDGNSQTSQRGLRCVAGSSNLGVLAYRLRVINCTNSGIYTGNDNVFIDCEVAGTTGGVAGWHDQLRQRRPPGHRRLPAPGSRRRGRDVPSRRRSRPVLPRITVPSHEGR